LDLHHLSGVKKKTLKITNPCALLATVKIIWEKQKVAYCLMLNAEMSP
jgi:hypothetical protein